MLMGSLVVAGLSGVALRQFPNVLMRYRVVTRLSGVAFRSQVLGLVLKLIELLCVLWSRGLWIDAPILAVAFA